LPWQQAKPLQISRSESAWANLTEQHGHELRPAGEAFGVALGLMLLDQQSECRNGEMIQ
jgi:hypothetical protein